MPRLIVFSASLEILSVDLPVDQGISLLSKMATPQTHSKILEICVSLGHPGKVVPMEASPVALVTASMS